MAGAILSVSTWSSGDPLGVIMRAGGYGALVGAGAGVALGGLAETKHQFSIKNMPEMSVMQGPNPQVHAEADAMYRQLVQDEVLRGHLELAEIIWAATGRRDVAAQARFHVRLPDNSVGICPVGPTCLTFPRGAE